MVEVTDWPRQVSCENSGCRINKIWTSPLDSLFILLGRCVQIQIGGIVEIIPLQRENVRSQFNFKTILAQEVSKAEFSPSVLENSIRLVFHVFITIMQVNTNDLSSQRLFEADRIHMSH